MAIQTFVADTILTAAQMNALQGNDYNQTVSTKTASYTLVAADKGTKIVMNAGATNTTITVNTSLFAAGDTLTILNTSTSGTCTITAGTATVATAGSLALGLNQSGTLYFTSAGVAVFQANGVAAAAPGLVCIKAETAFASNTAAVDSIFSSTYTYYRLLINYQTSASAVLMRLRVGGVAATTNYKFQNTQNYSTTFSGARTSTASSWTIAGTSGGAFTNFVVVDLYGVQLASPSKLSSLSIGESNGDYENANSIYGGSHTTSTAYDGFDINVSSGTLTGSYTVYGYSKAV